ncbi:hypothetical protein QZH41_001202 [Actinostola sp. cb2023]|nr:hypothetical protein QZH41_001202 [Actinostola sp. cb2023]
MDVQATDHKVADLQPSSKDALPLNNLPTNIVTDLSGKKELRIYHPADAFEKNLRAYISSILPFLKCRMDVQATDHKVADLQPSSKDALPLNNLPTNIVTDLSGKKELRIYHPADAFEKNLRAYISSILPFLKCRMDVQATDHKGMILRYVTAYVSKFKDQQTSQALYSRHINSAMAAYRHLSDMKPLEPEMVVTLSASKPAWTNNSTKRYIPPRPNNAEDSVMIRKYIARSDDIEHLSLLMWLRTYDTSKANPTPYKRNVSLVGVKYVSVYKPDYFFQYLIVNHPFKAIQDLQHVSHNVLPNELQYFVSALVLQRELWSDDENIRTLFRQQGNKEHYVFNVIHYVDSLRQLYHLWQMEVVTNANFQITNEVAPVQLSIEQQLVFAKLKVYLRLRSRHYASLHALQFEHIPPTPTNDTDSDSDDDDDETINDDPATESVAQRVNIVEQQECSDSLKESIASVLRHTRKQSQAIYDRRTTNQKKQGAVSLATELVHASSSRAIETRKEGKGDSCSFDIGDFVVLLEEGSTLKYPKIFIGQIQSFFEDNQASLLWYRNTRGSEYTFQFKPEPWLENIEALSARDNEGHQKNSWHLQIR